jgi:small subunit ribosomal protein S20
MRKQDRASLERVNGSESQKSMANTKSAKKAARQTLRRTEVNKARRSRMRTTVRYVEEAIAKGDANAALIAMKKAEPELAKAAQNGIVHKNAAARKVSRLVRQIRSLAV